MRTKVIDQRRQAGYFPYYKLQTWDTVKIAWMDVQARFSSPDDAFRHGWTHHQGKGLRVMTVSREGRSIWGRSRPYPD